MRPAPITQPRYACNNGADTVTGKLARADDGRLSPGPAARRALDRQGVWMVFALVLAAHLTLILGLQASQGAVARVEPPSIPMRLLETVVLNAPSSPPTPKQIRPPRVAPAVQPLLPPTLPPTLPAEAAMDPPVDAPPPPMPRAPASQEPESAPLLALATPAQPAPEPRTPEPAPAREPPVQPPRFDADYLSNPPPAYPPLSRRLGESGKVLLRVRVAVNGTPLQVELHQGSGYSRLDKAALDTVLRWRFIPAHQGDAATESWVIVPITFNLET